MANRKGLFATIFTGLIFLGFGLVWGSFQLGGEAPKVVPDNNYRQNPNSGSGNDGGITGEIFSGVVESLGPSIYMQGTHKLLSDDGEIKALLESSKIDLNVINGMKVKVEGKVIKTIEGQLKLIQVNKVIFDN